MLYIRKADQELEWHIGEAMPHISGPVVTFQADGHELIIILEALKNASRKVG